MGGWVGPTRATDQEKQRVRELRAANRYFSLVQTTCLLLILLISIEADNEGGVYDDYGDDDDRDDRKKDKTWSFGEEQSRDQLPAAPTGLFGSH